MHSDVRIDLDTNHFKYRVSGILIENNKLLTVQINNNGFYCLPGGHVEMMEESKDAMQREYFEETGINVEVVKPVFFVEDFFSSRSGRCHEVAIYYLLKTSDEINTEDFDLIENDKGKNTSLQFKWLDLNTMDNVENYKPDCLRKYIKNLNNNSEIKHFTIVEDKLM